jgi:hypothetical protein
MNTVQEFALSKIVKDARQKELRKQQSVGKHTVDLAVRVSGHFEVKADEQYTPTAHVPIKTALALFVRYSGITAPHALKLLERAMALAVILGEQGETMLKDFADLDKYEEQVAAMFQNLPKAKRSGKVLTTGLIVEELAIEQATGSETLTAAQAA